MTEQQIIDADGHVMELDEQLWEHMGAPYQGGQWHRSYAFFPSLDGFVRAVRNGGGSEGPTAAEWLQFLDENHVALTVLYPTQGLGHGFIQDPVWAVALAKAYNDWLYHHFLKQSPRLKGVALLPVQNIEAAVDELRRGVEELGMIGGVLPAATIDGRPYGNDLFHPLWREAVRLNVPLATHGGASSTLALDRVTSFITAHALEHMFAQSKQLCSMVFDGVYELFPDLRMAYLEAGVGWLPFILDRMDEEYERRGWYAPRLTKRPSEYVTTGKVYFTAEVEERVLPLAIETLGPDVFLWASDFPHERPRDGFSEDLPTLRARADVTEEFKQRLLWDNPRRFYGLA